MRTVAALGVALFSILFLGAMDSSHPPIQPCAECGVPPVPGAIHTTIIHGTTSTTEIVLSDPPESHEHGGDPADTSAPTTSAPVGSEGTSQAVAVYATPVYTG